MRRAIAAGVLVPFLALTSALAPEHLHEDADHSHAFVHRHFEPHHLESHDHSGAEIDHDGKQVVWLVTAVIQQAAFHFDPPVATPVEDVEAIPSDTSWTATTIDDAAPPHGPPRCSSSLRAPP